MTPLMVESMSIRVFNDTGFGKSISLDDIPAIAILRIAEAVIIHV